MVKQFRINRCMVNLFCLLFVAGCLLFTVNEAKAFEKNPKGWLGVSIEEMTPSMRDEYNLGDRTGLLITNVVHNSPADDAGLWEDDVIIDFDGNKVEKTENFTQLVKKITPGTTLKFKFMRDGKEKETEVTIGKLKSRRSSLLHLNEDFIFMTGRPRLGVRVEELNADLAPYFNVKEQSGVLIWEVYEDSPAENAGLKAGDVITKIDGDKISDSEDLIEVLEDYEKNDVVKVEYVRKGKTAEVELELESSNHFDIHIERSGVNRIRSRIRSRIRPHIQIRDFNLHQLHAPKTFRPKLIKEANII